MIALTPSDGLARLHWEAIKGFLEKLKGGTELGKLQLAVADLLGPQYDLGKVIMAEPRVGKNCNCIRSPGAKGKCQWKGL